MEVVTLPFSKKSLDKRDHPISPYRAPKREKQSQLSAQEVVNRLNDVNKALRRR